MNFWQVAAGSYDRDYTQSFLDYGMAFVGGDKAATMLQVQCGDGIVLKRGISEIVGAGVIVTRDGKCCGNGDKDWLTDVRAGSHFCRPRRSSIAGATNDEARAATNTGADRRPNP